MNLDTGLLSGKKIKSFMAKARDHIHTAEKAEAEHNWIKAGQEWFEASAALVISSSNLYGFPYAGEWGYFRAVEKMRIVWHEGWLESAFDAALILHFNASHQFLSNDQVYWRVNICKRFVNFLINKMEEEFKRLQSEKAR